jgi:RimJ/RimL family protein N-acetyltransferase
MTLQFATGLRGGRGVGEKTVAKLWAMTVRTATLSDAPILAEIHVAAWRAAYADHMSAELLAGMRVEDRTAMWQRVLSEPNPRTVAVKVHKADEPVAFCVYGPSRDQDAKDTDIGELIALNVHPAQWRKGHGQTLCLQVLAHARAQHWSAITLWVVSGNARARAFYEQLGFTADGTEKQDATLVGSVLHEVRYKLLVGTVIN